MCKITLTQEKVTKNTVRFTEVLEGKLTNPVIGTLYVPKETLKALSWEEGDDIVIDITSAGKPATTEKRKTAAEKTAASKAESAKKVAKKTTATKTAKKTATTTTKKAGRKATKKA